MLFSWIYCRLALICLATMLWRYTSLRALIYQGKLSSETVEVRFLPSQFQSIWISINLRPITVGAGKGACGPKSAFPCNSESAKCCRSTWSPKQAAARRECAFDRQMQGSTRADKFYSLVMTHKIEVIGKTNLTDTVALVLKAGVSVCLLLAFYFF